MHYRRGMTHNLCMDTLLTSICVDEEKEKRYRGDTGQLETLCSNRQPF